jgi:hypothetical protein
MATALTATIAAAAATGGVTSGTLALVAMLPSVLLLALTIAAGRTRSTGRAGRFGGSGAGVVETFQLVARETATDEALEAAQVAMFIGADEAERVAHGIGASGSSNAMNVVLVGHREIVVDDM